VLEFAADEFEAFGDVDDLLDPTMTSTGKPLMTFLSPMTPMMVRYRPSERWTLRPRPVIFSTTRLMSASLAWDCIR
jgi:hypothetical protein